VKEGEKLNKLRVLITADVIEECLSESLDVLEKNILPSRHIKIQKPLN